MSIGTRFVRGAFVSCVAGVFLLGGTAVADEDHDRPAYLIVSVAPLFDLDVGAGSPVVLVSIGNYIAGDSIGTTRFEGSGQVQIDLGDVPPDPETGLPPNFDGHQFTIVGSFKTLDPESKVHMVTPYPDAILPRVQQAFFNASPFFHDLLASDPFPTTVEVAQFIYDNQGAGTGASVQEILDGVLGTQSETLELVCESTCDAEGVLFPHDPGADSINNFHSLFDGDGGIVDVDIRLPVAIDVKPTTATNPVNLSSNGLLPVAVLTTDDFDAADELDPDTMLAVLLDDCGQVVGDGVGVDRWSYADVDGDGDTDVLLKFSIPSLVSGAHPPLSANSTSLSFLGETLGGMGVEGSDAVLVE